LARLSQISLKARNLELNKKQITKLNFSDFHECQSRMFHHRRLNFLKNVNGDPQSGSLIGFDAAQMRYLHIRWNVKTAFSLRFSSSSQHSHLRWSRHAAPVETDVVALIARPGHNLQARTAKPPSVSPCKKDKESKRERAKERRRKGDISCSWMTVSSKH